MDLAGAVTCPKMHLVLYQHQWERWLQTFFTIVLSICILWLEVSIFYAFSDLGLLWASIHRSWLS
jgi:uncharacterized protein involved in cysteine biosynthesis